MEDNRPYDKLDSSTIVTSTPIPKKEENKETDYQEVDLKASKSTEA